MRGTVRRCLRIRQAASEGEGETCAWWRRTVMVMLASFFVAGFMVVVVGKETGKMNDDSRVFCEGEKKKKPTVYTVLHTLTFI